jgi:hypothetical protein
MLTVGLRSRMACSRLESRTVVSFEVGVEEGGGVLAIDGCVLWAGVKDDDVLRGWARGRRSA